MANRNTQGFQGAPQGSTFFSKLGSAVKGGIGNLSLDPRGSQTIAPRQLLGRAAPSNALTGQGVSTAMGGNITTQESLAERLTPKFSEATQNLIKDKSKEQVLEAIDPLLKGTQAQTQGRGLGKITDFLGSDTFKNIASVALPVGAAALAAKYQKDFNQQRTDVNPQQTAGQAYFSTPLSERGSPEAVANRRLAGIMPSFNAATLARQTGISLEDAQNYLRSSYPGEVFAAMGGEIAGPGTGTSDSIPARLSDGEFVLTAQAVRGAGNGDRDLGAARMYDLMSRFERMA